MAQPTESRLITALCRICNTECQCDIEPLGYCCQDCSTLIETAIDAISQARQDGVPIYGPDTWRDANMAHRLDHAATHIYQYRQATRERSERLTEDHLAHAICDLVFVYATR